MFVAFVMEMQHQKENRDQRPPSAIPATRYQECTATTRPTQCRQQRENPAHRMADGVLFACLAERVGFEPTDGLPRHLLSREARSAGLRHLSRDAARMVHRPARPPHPHDAPQPSSRSSPSRTPTMPGGAVAEWTNAPVLKTGDLKGSEGSNPSRSANVMVVLVR